MKKALRGDANIARCL